MLSIVKQQLLKDQLKVRILPSFFVYFIQIKKYLLNVRLINAFFILYIRKFYFSLFTFFFLFSLKLCVIRAKINSENIKRITFEN